MTRRLLLVLVAVGIVAVTIVAGVISRQVAFTASSSPSTTSSVVASAALGRDMAIDVYAPPSVSQCADAPLLVLFHGRGGDAHQWMGGDLINAGVGVDTVADQLIAAGAIKPATIVSASIDDSYGVDSAPANDGYSHGPYHQYIVDELLPAVVSRYGSSARPLYIGGLSMGGFVALDLALAYPGRFAGVGALSPAFYVSPPADRSWMYSADGRPSILQRADAGAADGLALFLGVGGEDYSWIGQSTRHLDAVLSARGATVEMKTVTGGHDASTWHALVEPMLRSLFGQATSTDCA